MQALTETTTCIYNLNMSIESDIVNITYCTLFQTSSSFLHSCYMFSP